MPISKHDVEAVYQRYARKYDFAVNLYRLIGLRIEHYRSRAVDLLRLKRGDCVIDLGCGTGLNFPYLINRIGPEGRLIGVDISSEMLACAQQKVDAAKWRNVQLIHTDLTAYDFPNGAKGVLSTGVFGYIIERDAVIDKIAKALFPGGRIAIVDGKRPERWPTSLFNLYVRLASPFGVTPEYFDGRTWEIVERYFHETTFEEMYGGLVYIASGTASIKF